MCLLGLVLSVKDAVVSTAWTTPVLRELSVQPLATHGDEGS